MLKILEQLMVHWPLGKEYINTIPTKINVVFDTIVLSCLSFWECVRGLTFSDIITSLHKLSA